MIKKQSDIDRELFVIKKFYQQYWPLCGLCGHLVKNGDLAHVVRRSYSIELQTVKLNTFLSHRDCHDLWDNSPEQAVYLPRIIEILYISYLLSEPYFALIAEHYMDLSPVLQLFPEIPYQEINYHGELLTLQYLINQT